MDFLVSGHSSPLSVLSEVERLTAAVATQQEETLRARASADAAVRSCFRTGVRCGSWSQEDVSALLCIRLLQDHVEFYEDCSLWDLENCIAQSSAV